MKTVDELVMEARDAKREGNPNAKPTLQDLVTTSAVMCSMLDTIDAMARLHNLAGERYGSDIWMQFPMFDTDGARRHWLIKWSWDGVEEDQAGTRTLSIDVGVMVSFHYTEAEVNSAVVYLNNLRNW